ncbi:DMT family transporter [Daeguia caeni]|uniref:DMT family transporter n=1 Tax=Daeguia caeni TaxID=439612 RepID=A0ABV9H4I3_9HYPH
MQSKAPAGVETHVKGMALMVLGTLMLPLIDVTGKWLAVVGHMPPATLAFFRFLIQTVLTSFILLAARDFGVFRTGHLFGNMLRGALLGLGGVMFFTSIKYMPIADAMAVFFAEPLVLTILSVFFLHEKIGWRRITSVTIGLIGTLIVIQPSFEVFGFVSLLPLITAVTFAIYVMLNRKFGANDTPFVMQFYAGIGGCLVSIAVMIFGTLSGVADLQFMLPMEKAQWPLLLFMGGVGMLGHLLVVQACKLAPASLLAPFQYLEIVMAVIFGLILFDEFPTPSKWLGIAIVIGSGIYVFMRERKLKQAG